MKRIREHLLHRRKRILYTFLLSRVVYIAIIIAAGSNLTDICTIWDNEHYIAIAQNGYTQEWQTAFFPAIPLLIRYLGKTGLLILNQLAVLLSMFLFDSMITEEDFYVIEFFAFSPIGFFSLMLYTEAILIFFTLLTYYLFVKRRFGYGFGIIIGFSVAIKSIGAMLFFAIFIGMCYLWHHKQIKLRNIIETYIPATIISCIYPIYLQIFHDNWRLFVDCQYDYWCRMKTNFFEELLIQISVIFSKSEDVLYIFRINEIITLLIAGFIVYGLYRCVTLCKNKRYDVANAIVIICYIFFSIVVINSSIRIPYNNAPTTSFYRYYYSLFPIYIFAGFLEGRTRRYIFFCSVFLSFMIAVLFSANYYFF